ncbi:MAG: hypothetical protein GKR88_07870 [Flavobacteriaceae bacterium]|nr:MAG: hypothetical protein GKR88_07870 [Flavobacteriaceae bacterium]
MKNKINIALIALLAMFITSCSDDNSIQTEEITESKVASFEDYFEFLNTETNGSVIVQSVKTPLSNEAFMASSSINGNKQPLALKVDENTVSFTNYQYSETANKSYSNVNLEDMSTVFGNQFSVDVTPEQIIASRNSSSSNDSNIESVYIPNLINAQFAGLSNGKIVVGSQISWNFDSQNENGVVIGLEYNPLSQLEESIVSQKSDRLLKGVTLADSGTYTITAQDLAEFPSNSMLTFYVGRAGYNIATDDSGSDYSLAGLTVSRADLQIVK